MPTPGTNPNRCAHSWNCPIPPTSSTVFEWYIRPSTLCKMASFRTFVYAEPGKRKRTETSEEVYTVHVTKALLQFSSKQDVEPASLRSDTHIALLAGDGHDGDVTAKYLSKNARDILKETLKNGVESGMAMSQFLCRDFVDGAMLVIAHYEFATRIIRIISVGDASCSIYQNNELVHRQPHQDAETFMEEHVDGCCAGETFEGKAYGTVEIQRINPFDNSGDIKTAGKLTPQPDGKTMMYPKKPSYLRFRVQGNLLRDVLASGGFVGHKDVPRLPPVITEFTIPDGPFHVVMTSDGVSDVMHPEDALPRRDDVIADEILEECKKRWTGGWSFNGNTDVTISRVPTTITVNNRRVSKYERKPDGGYKVVYEDDEGNITWHEVPSIEETNKGSDDISVIVFSSK